MTRIDNDFSFAMTKFYLILTICALILPATSLAPSFCKCTCFTNSTIIPLSSHPQPLSPEQPAPRAPLVGCVTCNKAFCLSHRLPICKDAEEKDVATACFQRDSRQDKIVVVTFIAGTVGLLVWAGIKRLLDKKEMKQSLGQHE
ncbi:hypothetical protein GcM3_02586 [Golovinomyces cichoracearum]|uniref:AN1-type domain-containing protein n=1 Tax=Golovinomyces cichoracearum TaxID=62708 RepID=A0A420H7P7_9PEZI|nr:hypothetical protein GcM3_02586 [Golovinomyces cichoracearum]